MHIFNSSVKELALVAEVEMLRCLSKHNATKCNGDRLSEKTMTCTKPLTLMFCEASPALKTRKTAAEITPDCVEP